MKLNGLGKMKQIFGNISLKTNTLQNRSRIDRSFFRTSTIFKFYLQLDNESPGKVGRWIGWQIVKILSQK